MPVTLQEKTRDRINNLPPLKFWWGTFYRGTKDIAEHNAMLGKVGVHPHLVSGRQLAGLLPSDLADMNAEDIHNALVIRESVELAGGRNTTSHFIPLSMSKTVSSGFGGKMFNATRGASVGNSAQTAKTFQFDIWFVLYGMSLDDKDNLLGIRSFVRDYQNLPRDIFPLFAGNPVEKEFFAYTGTAIFDVQEV